MKEFVLISPERCKGIFDRVLKFSDADETEALIAGGAHQLTRFANNTIHQNVAEEGCVLSIRTVYGGRTARATTNKFDDASIRRVVEDSASVARQQQPNPDLLPMPGPQECAPVERFYPATAELTPEARAHGVREAVEIARRRGQTAAGIFSSGAAMQAILNSAGLFVYHQDTRSEFSVTMLGGNSSGWAKANSPDVRNINVEELALRASAKAALSAEPVELKPERYTVILEPAAVLDLVGFLFYDFSGLAIHDQRSFLTGRLGMQLFGENISIADDVYHPLQSGAPFDGEGMYRKTVPLVERGVVRNVVYSRQTAKLMQAEPTGHGFPLPNEFGEAPMNIVIAGGDASVDNMIAGTERGILVTRLWYIREVDPYEKVLTGMTRDGTFLIEDGQARRGILNFRFNQSMIEMLSKVEMLGPAERAAGEEAFEMVLPAMKVRDFNFTEVTKF
jgi:predicted Zn-dependent protease